MIELTLSRYGYVELDTADYLAALGDKDETLTENFNSWFAARIDADDFTGTRYTDETAVDEWLAQLTDDDGETHSPTGLYGEDGPWHLGSTYNHETILSNDIILTLAHVGFLDLLIVHGEGFTYEREWIGNGHTGVYVLNNGEDADVVTLWDRAYLTHETPDLTTAETLTGETVRIGCDWSATLEDSRWSRDDMNADYPGSDPDSVFELDSLYDEDTETYKCPECGAKLAAYALTS